MKIATEDLGFKQELKETANSHNIRLTDKMLESFEIFKDMLLEWNDKVNLTAITEEKEIIVKHFVDSLECVKYIKEGNNVIDVGTGAGFPGIVIAIYFENEVNITLLDSLAKRLNFIQEVVKKLDIRNVIIVHGRTEDEGHKKENREHFDAATARAVAQLSTLLEYTIPYIKVGGHCILMKGDNARAEIESTDNALEKLSCKITKVDEYTLKCSGEEFKRNIIEVEKLKKTPDIYPRNPLKIKKEPL